MLYPLLNHLYQVRPGPHGFVVWGKGDVDGVGDEAVGEVARHWEKVRHLVVGKREANKHVEDRKKGELGGFVAHGKGLLGGSILGDWGNRG